MSSITAASAILDITSHFYRKDQLQKKMESKKFRKKIPSEQNNIIINLKNQINNGMLEKSRKKCPECYKNFSLININGISIDYCTRCKSLWFDFGELARLSGFYPDIPAQHLAYHKSEYKCPICEIQMNEYLFKEKNNLLADKCPNNHGIYLMNSEIERVFT